MLTRKRLTENGNERTRTNDLGRARDKCNPVRTLAAEMLAQMIRDLTMDDSRIIMNISARVKKKKSTQIKKRKALEAIRARAISDLRKFREWPIFEAASHYGMPLPSPIKIERLIEMDPADLEEKIRFAYMNARE